MDDGLLAGVVRSDYLLSIALKYLPMTPPEIREKFIAILDSILAIKPDKVNLESDIIRDLHADSLDIVEIVIECELEFAVDIPDEDAEKLKTVKEWVEYLEKAA